MDNLEYSRRNRTDVKFKPELVRQILPSVVDGFVHSRKRKPDCATFFKYFRHFRIVMLDLMAAYLNDPDLYVGYSRGDKHFRKGGSYWDYQKDTAILSRDIFLNVIEYLADNDFIENHKQDAGCKKRSSRMRATEKLMKLTEGHRLSWASVRCDPAAPVFKVKDKKKKLIPYPEPIEGELLQSYENLQRINRNLETSFLSINISDADMRDLKEKQMATYRASGGDTEREPIDFTRRTLWRQFAEGSFKKGGRFYGGWWQGVPSDLRKFIEVEGCITCEMDFATLQPRILYAQERLTPPEDAYLPPGWDKSYRKLIKKAFNQIVNCDASMRPAGRWRAFAPALTPEVLPDRWYEFKNEHQRTPYRRDEFKRLTGRDYSELIQDLVDFHKPIQDQLFCKKWADIQYIDSQIAERVMIKLLDAEVPITALPIHDSFIVRRGGEQSLLNAMNEAFEELLGVECKIDKDETVYDADKDAVHRRPYCPDHEEVGRDMIAHSQHHRRFEEWKIEYGPNGYE